jgi:dTDP-4-dehydrorhamnose reductase
MEVLVTGAYGRCGTAIIDHLHDRAEYEFTYLNRSDPPDDHPYGGFETVVGDVENFEAIRPAFADQRAVVHLAAYPYTSADWDDVLGPNIVGMYNTLEAAREANVDSFVFGSSNHVMGMYEVEGAPELYELDADVHLDHTDPVRPDSFYASSKSFGEDLARYYVENYDYPKRVYVVRIGSVRHEAYDHPYGDAEAMVEDGDCERGDESYDREVRRIKATWHSRRDFAHMVDRCLQDRNVSYDVFYGVSDNDRRWFDIEHAREVIGYDPQDNGERWDGPPD